MPCPFFGAGGGGGDGGGGDDDASVGPALANALSFSYDRGRGECARPPSAVRACTRRSAVAMHYQACPNVKGSEMMSEYYSTQYCTSI